MPLLNQRLTANAASLSSKVAKVFAGLAFAVVGTSACSNDTSTDLETGLVAESTDEGSVIVGSLNWQDVGVLSDSSAERVNSRAVGYLSIPARGTRCTGFLVAPDLVMTNEHCIPAASSAQGVRFSMRREAGVSSSQWDTYDCSTFVGNSRSLDYALLQCSQRIGDTYGVVTLESRQTRTQDALYVIHQNCDYYSQSNCNPTKKISRGQVVLVNSEIGHNADTLGGSSGSPVFASDTHAVFGLHHVGIGGNSNGRGSYNKAVAMRDILSDVANRFPNVSFGAGTTSTGGLQPDSFEPNDDASSATTAPPNATGEDFTITASDRDVFRVDLPASGTLTVNISFPHSAGDLDMTMNEGSLNGTQIGNAASATDDETIEVESEATTVYVTVFGYNGATNAYDISFGFESDAPVVSEPDPVPTGAEPNDSFDDASLLAAPVALSGVEISTATDEDVYRVDHVGGVLDAAIDFTHADGDLDLFLFNANNTEIGRSNGVTNRESISQTLAAGTYYLRVVGYQGATGTYDIALQ